MDENNPSEGFSIDAAVQALKDSREQPKAEAEVEATDPEETEEVEAEHVEVEEVEAEADTDPEVHEEADDQPEEDPDEGAEAGDEDVFELEGVEFTLSQLKEWKEGGLRTADYTKKTQEVAEARKAFEAERGQFEAERQQATDYISQREKQLQDALAAFAIEQNPKPKRSEFPSTDAYLQAQDAWEEAEARKGEAQQLYKGLQAQQQQEMLTREMHQLTAKKPEWRDQAQFQGAVSNMVKTAAEFGFSQEEFGAIPDHRMFLVLDELTRLRAAQGEQNAKDTAAAKKVVKAVRPLSGAKPANKSQTAQLQKLKDRMRQTGSPEDAVKYMQAKRAAR